MEKHIADWSVRENPYRAPELGRDYLCGRLKSGKHVETSYIRKCEGRVVTTSSGSQYRLGRISKKYRAWVKKNGFLYDPKQPLPFKKA